ncbi:hypothetical protein [Agromyces humi]|uniref:hypothetical protein n=1 Tax=Agromyces humi TaxID=1766800 RepID=UPI0013587AB3|nr:hypothetical protein [Agromyces humi]
MARTEKDTPLWVLLNRPENIVGYRHRCGGWSYGRRENRAAGFTPCDAHEEHDRYEYRRCRPILASTVHWTYDACWGWKRPRNGGRAGFGHDRAGNRAGNRDDLRELVKLRRAAHEVDDSHLINQQRRHTVYGWWAD